MTKLCANQRLLLCQVRLQRLDVRELGAQVLRGDGMLDESVGDGFGVRGMRVERDGGGGECGEGLRALGR